MKKARLWVFLAGLVSVLLLTCLFSASALAAGPSRLLVNGVDILRAPEKKVECGNGAATYDEASHTLTLDNAEIIRGEVGIGIYGGDLTIELVGNSTISIPVRQWGYGIKGEDTVTITGAGSLDIGAENLPDFYKATCIEAKQVVVAGATLRLEPQGAYDTGITSTNGNVTLQNRANVTVFSRGWQEGIKVGGDARVLEGSTLTLQGSFDGNSGGMNIGKNLEIDSSTVMVTLEAERAGAAFYARENVIITNSNVTIQSNSRQRMIYGEDVTVRGSTVNITVENEGERTIYAISKLTIEEQSEVTVRVHTSNEAIYAGNGIVIRNSTVTANSQGEGRVLFSWGRISVMDGGALKATGQGTKEPALYAQAGLTVADTGEVMVDGGSFVGENGVTLRPAPDGHMRVHAARHVSGAADFEGCYGTEQNVFNNGELNEYFHVHIRQYAHTMGQTWERDAANHWHACTACGAKADEQPHNPGAWEWDDNGHWRSCVCGARQGEAEHTPADGWAQDDASHWHPCTTCGVKLNLKPHAYAWVTDKQPGSGAPGAKHEQCTACAYAKPPVAIPALPTPTASAAGSANVPQTGDSAPLALWLALLLASGTAVAALLIVRKNRKR